MQKIISFHLFVFEIQTFSEFHDQCPHTFLTMLTQKVFHQFLYFDEFEMTCKRWSYFTILFQRYSWFKNPAIWLAETLYLKREFSRCRKITNKIYFQYIKNSGKKIMARSFNKLKNTYFWPIFGAKFFFSKNLALSFTTSYGFLTPCQI